MSRTKFQIESYNIIIAQLASRGQPGIKYKQASTNAFEQTETFRLTIYTFLHKSVILLSGWIYKKVE